MKNFNKISKVIMALIFAMFITSALNASSDYSYNENTSYEYGYSNCDNGCGTCDYGCHEHNPCRVYKRRAVRAWHKYRWTGKTGALKRYRTNMRVFRECKARW